MLEGAVDRVTTLDEAASLKLVEVAVEGLRRCLVEALLARGEPKHPELAVRQWPSHSASLSFSSRRQIRSSAAFPTSLNKSNMRRASTSSASPQPLATRRSLSKPQKI